MFKSIVLTAAVMLATPAWAADKVVDSISAAPISVLPMHVGGRVRKEKMGYSYQWPGIYFEARFDSPYVNLLFNDDANTFNVLIDGKPLMVVDRPGHTTITIQATGHGPHTVRVEKRSETQYATGQFQGFMAQPSASPSRLLPRQIEFIGDSLTVGYGNTSAFSQCTTEQIFETTDAQQGFGPVTAKHFNADYQINAFSGLGMVRNYDGREHPKYRMPMLYERAIFDDPTPVRQPDWHPQVVVIGIGGNDFSTDVRPDEPWQNAANLRADYVKTYTAFVKTVRARNPDAWIVLATPQERQEGYIGGTDDVFAALKAAGDTKIDRVSLPELDAIGCNGHPSTRADARVADFYIKYFEAHPQVWQGK
ncbi:SGNH/GDSL hydrolase family protein [Asticcacaulis sp. 201]|uniref:SGNH/GDSL hydrolase family protein n=1 Tax=Asticcacaulis sp. 201 TaxID=3028787 RepID=UPI002916743C|nr:GDSL-type esterase/lipase family protein [Asticcacaulis sp. 201]MDV6332710.1 GDSL-type esterase/lipase family protein [Asticcacaulis sp. 201]